MFAIKNSNNHIIKKLLMKHGGKNTSEVILKKTVKSLQKNHKKNYLDIVRTSIVNSYNVLLLKSSAKPKRFKGKIPYIIKKKNRIILCIKNIILATKTRSKAPIFLNFREELLNSAKQKSTSVQSELYKTIYLQKNFAHYRWFV